MTIPEFDEKELIVRSWHPDWFGGSPLAEYTTPVSSREGVLALYKGKPLWQLCSTMGPEILTFTPNIIPDNVARAFVSDHSFVPGVSNQSGGKDMFGIEWEYEAEAGGSMVRPGNPLATTMDELLKKVVWPDVDSWDWEGAREANRVFFQKDRAVSSWIFTGFFERLISMMDFENAAMALIDEDQEEDVCAFIEKLSDTYIKISDKLFENFPQIDIIYVHDDWGAQKDTFFSPKIAEKLIVPYMKKVTDFIHSKGRIAELHSCGMNEKQLENIIQAGWDGWCPQTMNDMDKLYKQCRGRIVLGIMPEAFDVTASTEEQQREYARRYVEKYCNPDNPSMLSVFANMGVEFMTPVYREELYCQSRIRYSK